MSSQKFYADPNLTFTWPNGAVGHRPSASFDCLGPYAKVRNCPIHGTDLRLTCYATGYADTHFSIPACTKLRGKYVAGYFTIEDENISFRVMDRHKGRVPGLSPPYESAPANASESSMTREPDRPSEPEKLSEPREASEPSM